MTTNHIIDALGTEINKHVPKAHHYKGSVPETPLLPYFVYHVVNDDTQIKSFFSINKRVSLQVAYSGNNDGYTSTTQEEKEEIVSKLAPLLSSCVLNVDDRSIVFSVKVNHTDDGLNFIISMKYEDKRVDVGYEEEQNRKHMEIIKRKETLLC